jgi:hypothetical protein
MRPTRSPTTRHTPVHVRRCSTCPAPADPANRRTRITRVEGRRARKAWIQSVVSGQTISRLDANGSRNLPGESVPRVATRTCGWGRPRATAAGWTGGPSRLEVMGIVHEAGSSPGRTDCTGWSLKKRHPLIQRADVGTLSLHLGTLVLQGPAHLLLRTIIRVVVVEGPFISAKEIEIRAEHRLCGAVAGKLSTRRLTGTKQNHTGRQARQGYL